MAHVYADHNFTTQAPLTGCVEEGSKIDDKSESRPQLEQEEKSNKDDANSSSQSNVIRVDTQGLLSKREEEPKD